MTAPDETDVFFEGSEGDALRVANLMAPMVGGDYYTLIDGFISKLDNKLIFEADDAFDLDSRLRVIIGQRIESLTIEWPSE